ncbi:MAG: SurA N-terminal domain-containing protein [Xanthobacteraceae bacterium]|nr:SurA N-terminal domain-containing protein [Xanthobacteraceae bacterium]
MLRGIRTASANWLGRIVMGAVFGLIAISFAIWGIGDVFRGFGRSGLARIGGTEITIEQFRSLYSERLQQLGRQLGRPITLDQAQQMGLDKQLVGQLIGEATLDERVKALGLGISDAEMSRRIMDNPEFRGPTGQFDRQLFEMRLRQNQTNERRFLDEQRRLILRRQLAGTVINGTQLPKAAMEAADRFQNEQRSVEYVLLERAQAGEIPDPTPEQLAKYFEERKALFRAPEYRRIVILPLIPGEQAMWTTVSDADVQKAYEDRRARYLTPERRELQQIVFNNQEDAQAAADRIAKGESFLDIAKERKLTEKETDLGLLTRAAIIDQAIANAAFALQENGVSEPVKGRFGIVLVRVVKIEPEAVRPFAEVRDELRKELANERARAEILPLYDKIEDERSIGRPLAEAAANLKLAVRTIEVNRQGVTPSGKPEVNIPDAQRLITQAFNAEVGVENDPLQVQGGYVWYEVAAITPERERKLDEVKDELETRWRDDQVANLLRAKAAELLEKLKAGAPFADVMKAAGLKVETRADIKRGNAVAPFSARTIDAIFRTAKDAYDTADAAAPGEQIVFRVTGITMPEVDPKSEDAARIRDALNQGFSTDVFGGYLAYLQRLVGVTINDNALRQVVTGQSQSQSSN